MKLLLLLFITYFFLLLLLDTPNNRCVAQQAPIVFIKTLDGEKFRADLVPSLFIRLNLFILVKFDFFWSESKKKSGFFLIGSIEKSIYVSDHESIDLFFSFSKFHITGLEKNVSYVMAIDLRNSQLIYSLESDFFTIDALSGRVFLISQLPTSFTQQQQQSQLKSIRLSASNGIDTIQTESHYSIVNANNQPPEFVTSQRIFDIVEDNQTPVDFTHAKNGSSIQIVVADLDPTNLDIQVQCESNVFYADACDFFGFRKDLAKSNSQMWYGTLVANKKLNYLERSIFQFYAVARVRHWQTLYHIIIL